MNRRNKPKLKKPKRTKRENIKSLKKNTIYKMYDFDLYEKMAIIWCEQQRIDYKNGKLSEYQIEMLERLPGWYW